MTSIQQRINDRLSEGIQRETDRLVDEAINVFFGKGETSSPGLLVRKIFDGGRSTPVLEQIQAMIEQRIADELGMKSATTYERTSLKLGDQSSEDVVWITDRDDALSILDETLKTRTDLLIDDRISSAWVGVCKGLKTGDLYMITLKVDGGRIFDHEIVPHTDFCGAIRIK